MRSSTEFVTVPLFALTFVGLLLHSRNMMVPAKSTSYKTHESSPHSPSTPLQQPQQPQQLHPAFVFPQLYRCPAIESQIPAEHQSQSNEDIWLYEKIFSRNISRSKGTFLEIGALDGMKYSNTWYFEKAFDWRGILIEGLPSNQPNLRGTSRVNVAVFTAGICKDNPGSLTFTQGGGAVGGTKEFSTPEFLLSWHGSRQAATVQAACVPLRLILAATGILDIELFSLDVEGAELAVLETIDWNVTNIYVIVVEMDNSSPSKDQAVRDLLTKQGFEDAVQSFGSIRSACLPGGDCTMNEVYVNPHFYLRKRPDPVRFVYGTGLMCQ